MEGAIAPLSSPPHPYPFAQRGAKSELSIILANTARPTLVILTLPNRRFQPMLLPATFPQERPTSASAANLPKISQGLLALKKQGFTSVCSIHIAKQPQSPQKR